MSAVVSQPDNCGRRIRLFAASLRSEICIFARRIRGTAKWNAAPIPVDEFSARYLVKFVRCPAAGYHFHDLTGGEVNFVGIFSEGSRGAGNRRPIFCFVLNFFHRCCKRARRVSSAVPTCAWARVTRGVSNPNALSLAANWKKNWIPPGCWALYCHSIKKYRRRRSVSRRYVAFLVASPHANTHAECI